MNPNIITNPDYMLVSQMAENLVGSEIIKLAGEVKARIQQGEKIFNLTIGDFDPAIFPIPDELKSAIIQAYKDNETNYPMANGMLKLREQVSLFLKKYAQLNYSSEEILVSAGSRPLIYATYRAIMDPGDVALYPVPSWNNNHYTHLTTSESIIIKTRAENKFMPQAEDMVQHIGKVNLIALCSPLNPTGTIFSKENLKAICELILEENAKRVDRKPVYLLYDQIYWLQTYGSAEHFNPVNIYPEMKPYVVSIDGLSKSYAATGVRVGWAYGDLKIIDKMKSILSHVGAWSPRAEQLAVANYLSQESVVQKNLNHFKNELHQRLDGFYKGFQTLKSEGYPVEAISPEAAIYLTVKIDLVGKKKADGSVIRDVSETTSYLLNEAKIALVPFYCFGSDRDRPWYRLSVGTTIIEDIDQVISQLRNALNKLS